jgi:unsaturated rhamnogalacturonyl hydrolase
VCEDICVISVRNSGMLKIIQFFGLAELRWGDALVTMTTISAAPRPRRAYDHRLREHVLRSGARSLARHMAIPRSTVATWQRRGLRPVVTIEPSGRKHYKICALSSREATITKGVLMHGFGSRLVSAAAVVLVALVASGCGKAGGSGWDSAMGGMVEGGFDSPVGTGGAIGSGGSWTGAGGATGTGAVAGAGAGSGGVAGTGTGGNTGTGGIKGSGGATGTGGVAGNGTGTGSGGRIGAGGAAGGFGTGSGTGGGPGSAGSSGSGGTKGSGGSSGTGGTTGPGGAKDAGADAGPSLVADSLAVRFANAVMTNWPDPSNITKTAAFEYNHGIVLRGMEQVYRRTSDARYLAYIKKYVDAYVSDSGVVDIPSEHSFDNIQPSVLLPFLYQQTGTAKYQLGANSIRARYDSIPRNADKGFWHKQSCPNQMWLDSIYMGEPFLARYGAVFGTCGTFCADTVVEQVLLIADHVRDTATGLLYHAWDDSAAGQKASWADPTTGRSPIIWGRAMGWYAMALVDTLGDLPPSQSNRSDMLAILAGLAAGLKNTQDKTTGLWYQVADQGSKSDNWLETSASGMFVYALKVAVNRGYIDASYLSVADSGWQGLKSKVTTDTGGLPTINGAVQGMGVQTSYSGYINQSTLSNSPHGLCAILLAASEMEAR